MANVIYAIKVSGTSTERAAFALTLSAKDAGFLFYEVSGAKYEWNGSAFVQKSSDSGIIGTPQTFILNAIATPTDADANRIIDATGYKAFRVRSAKGLTALVTGIAFGWSTVTSDFTVVNASCTALLVDIVTPSGAGQANENTQAILPVQATAGLLESSDWIQWDGVTTIKTILVKSVGADQGAMVVEVVI